MEQQSLLESIDLSKPWDHPDNRHAHSQTPTAYQCPSCDLEDTHTIYVGVVGEDCVFHPTRGRQLEEISDGTGNTIFVIEVDVDSAVNWMCPDDVGLRFLTTKLGPNSNTAHVGGIQAGLVDGGSRFFSTRSSPNALRAMTTIAGGEYVENLAE